VIPVALYNLLALGFGGAVETIDASGQIVRATSAPILGLLNGEFMGLPMISGVDWVLTKGDAILLLAIVFLFLEILKSTSTGTSTIVNHGLSMVVFVVAMALFLLVGKFATSAFFLLTLMALMDTVGGFVVTVVAARRDLAVGGEG
jgi:hypothetical protein